MLKNRGAVFISSFFFPCRMLLHGLANREQGLVFMFWGICAFYSAWKVPQGSEAAQLMPGIRDKNAGPSFFFFFFKFVPWVCHAQGGCLSAQRTGSGNFCCRVALLGLLSPDVRKEKGWLLICTRFQSQQLPSPCLSWGSEGSVGCVVWLNQSFLFLLCAPKTLPTPTSLVDLWTRQKNRTVNGIVLGATALWVVRLYIEFYGRLTGGQKNPRNIRSRTISGYVVKGLHCTKLLNIQFWLFEWTIRDEIFASICLC